MKVALSLPLGFVLDFLFFWISFRCWILATIRIALVSSHGVGSILYCLSFLDFQRMFKSLRRRTVSTFRRIHTQRFTNSMKVAKWKSPTLKCLTFSLHYVWKPPIWINRRAVQHMLCSLGLLLWFWSVGVDLLLLLLWLSLIFKHFYGCLLFLFLPLWSFAAYLLLFSPSPKTYLETSPYSLNHFFAPSLSLPLPFCISLLWLFGLRLCLLFISDSTPMCLLPHLRPQQTPHHPCSSSWHLFYPKCCSLIGHLNQNA